MRNQVPVATCGDGDRGLQRWRAVLKFLDSLNCPVVIDISAVEFDLSEIDTYLLALEFEHLESIRNHRLGFVTDSRSDTAAAFFVTCARNRGVAMEKFSETDRAIAWVSSSPG